MPEVPQYNHKPLKTIYNPIDTRKPASMKQKNYIAILCERRKLPAPDFKRMTSGEAAQIISNMVNSSWKPAGDNDGKL